MYSREIVLEKTQLAVADWLVVFASAMAATWLRHGLGVLSRDGGGGVPWIRYLFPAALVAAAFVLVFRYQSLYSVHYGRLVEAFRILKGASLATMVVITLTFFYRGYSYSRATVVLFYPLVLLALFGSRSLFRVYRRALMTSRDAVRRVLIVGFGETGQHLAREILQEPGYYRLIGFLDDDPAKLVGKLEGVPVLGTAADLSRVIRDRDVDEVLLAMPSAPQERVMGLVGECLRLKVRWKTVPNLLELMLDRVHVDRIGDLPLIGLRGSQLVGINWWIKRAFDLAFASTVMVVFAPLFLAIAAAIKLTSRGPVLYKQVRIGYRGRPFTFLKFRSMKTGSDAGIHRDFTADWIYGRTGGEVPPRSVGAGAAQTSPPESDGVHKITRDPRVTAVGRLLRKTSLDELPQFWNVLRGEMSVVGPRPPIPYEVERYTEWHKRRLETLPGITGLWQVSGRNALSFDEMVRLDIRYIENWSLEEDIRIILKTVPALLLGKAY